MHNTVHVHVLMSNKLDFPQSFRIGHQDESTCTTHDSHVTYPRRARPQS